MYDRVKKLTGLMLDKNALCQVETLCMKELQETGPGIK